ncbi:hypothetical protein D3C75_439120 [compost metagenome]
MCVNNTFNNWLDHFKYDIFNIFRLQNLTALFINNFTLLIHHVIILQYDFTNIKVITFNTFLSRFHSTRNHAALNRLIFLKPKAIHHTQNVVSAKTLHQLITKGQVELCRTWVPLTTRTTTQLVINPARFMTLCTNDMQTSKICHTFAQNDVRTTTCHVGSNRNCTWLTCMCNDFSFRSVMLRVKHLVSNAFALQHFRYEL